MSWSTILTILPWTLTSSRPRSASSASNYEQTTNGNSGDGLRDGARLAGGGGGGFFGQRIHGEGDDRYPGRAAGGLPPDLPRRRMVELPAHALRRRSQLKPGRKGRGLLLRETAQWRRR